MRGVGAIFLVCQNRGAGPVFNKFVLKTLFYERKQSFFVDGCFSV